MKHEFEITEKYNENGVFLGDLFVCKNCGKEHLCTQNNPIGGRCMHLDEFYIGCNKNNDRESLS